MWLVRTRMNHRNIDVAGLSLHVAEAGERGAPAVIFLHGWPQCWAAFKQVMPALAERAHTIAIDLPGIGGSETRAPLNDKRTLARYVHAMIGALDLRDVTLVGHDIGGQIVYAYLHEYQDLARAVLMNIVIPGIDPWADVIRNPHIWHFAFHAIPELPEALVTDRLAPYFDYFYNVLAATPDGVPASVRREYAAAYSRPEALRTGFDWYRAFAQDEKANLADKHQPVNTPVLYLRGDKEPGDIDRYVAGLRDGGLRNVRSSLIANSGHFTPDEQPAQIARVISEFIQACPSPDSLQYGGA